MFPSLVNCCTIDWFTEWPEDALEKVATKFLEDMDMDDEVTFPHYSKSQIFVQKFNFDKNPTFSRVFSPNLFDNFSREIEVANS